MIRETEREFLEDVNRLNRCNFLEMEKAGRKLDPHVADSCAVFYQHVRNLQASIIFNYQLTAMRAIRRADPGEAAELWLGMKVFCEDALKVLREFKDLYPQCGTRDLYDLTLDYRAAAEERYLDNQKDNEWKKEPVPERFLAKPS